MKKRILTQKQIESFSVYLHEEEKSKCTIEKYSLVKKLEDFERASSTLKFIFPISAFSIHSKNDTTR